MSGTATAWTPSPEQLVRRRVARQQRIRGWLLASVATVVVIGGLIVVLVSSPGWESVKATFFSTQEARDAFPEIAEGFWLNVKLFVIAEPLVLILATLVAVVRTTTSPLLFPLRMLAVAFADLFRGVPTILVLILLAFGMPALGLQGVTNSLFFWALVALTLSYSAYVAEVIRSGIESIHPSQLASAASLGLTHGQTMRKVVLPQAYRRVVPPLLNDFVSLQKDTALVVSVGLLDALGTANDIANFNFNYTPIVLSAAFFVVMTVPLARFTDWLQRRSRLREWGRVR